MIFVGRSLPVLCVHLFHWYGLMEHFNLDVVRVWKLFSKCHDVCINSKQTFSVSSKHYMECKLYNIPIIVILSTRTIKTIVTVIYFYIIITTTTIISTYYCSNVSTVQFHWISFYHLLLFASDSVVVETVFCVKCRELCCVHCDLNINCETVVN